jgi:hypothetical protein
MKPLTLLLPLALALSSAHCAASPEEDLVYLAQLSTSALQCSLYAANKGESSRLLTLGVDAGRRYLELVSKEPDAYKRIWQKVPGVYIQGESPSAEFLVGQVYGILQAEAERNEVASKEVGTFFRAKQYINKNCALIK